jgi:D-amino peptidase
MNKVNKNSAHFLYTIMKQPTRTFLYARTSMKIVMLFFLFPIQVFSQPKILLYYDMEGISGINCLEMTLSKYPEYKQGQNFLTNDVNAAIAGLKDGGAGEIIVTDSHGSGNSNPDILLDQMDKRATLEMRDSAFFPYFDSPDSSYQAIVCIGMHARAHTNGFLEHTCIPGTSLTVNNVNFTETTIIAVSAARFGIPIIMVSGDDVLAEQIKEQFPLIQYALVKHTKSRASCDTLSQQVAQNNIYRAAKKAMSNLAKYKPFVFEPPFEFRMSFQNRTQADWASFYPGLTRVDDITVAFTSNDFIQGFNLWRKLIDLSRGERLSLIFQILDRHPEAKGVMDEYRNIRHLLWLDPEKVPKEENNSEPQSKRKQVGIQ